jgi:hypothetical protein
LQIEAKAFYGFASAAWPAGRLATDSDALD